MKFKEGDKVILKKSFEYEDSSFNPKWEGKFGKITGVVLYASKISIEVLWENGKSNSYRPECIAHAPKTFLSHPYTTIFK